MQRLSIERRAVKIETATELRCQMLRVGSTASIAAEMYFAISAQTIYDDVGSLLNMCCELTISKDGLLHLDTLLDGLVYS